jgi:hypothetical protein
LFPQKGIVTFGHINYFELIEKGIIGKKFDKKAFKFCFVRNPYDRAVSLYHYFKRRNRIRDSVSFQMFCEILMEKKFEDIGLYHWRGFSQCNPQVNWIKDKNNRVKINFIGKYESLNEDFNNLCTILKIPNNFSLPKLNISERNHFKEYFTEKSVAIINTIYNEDFEFFNYSKSI